MLTKPTSRGPKNYLTTFTIPALLSPGAPPTAITVPVCAPGAFHRHRQRLTDFVAGIAMGDRMHCETLLSPETYLKLLRT
jgi:hypothetical protein